MCLCGVCLSQRYCWCLPKSRLPLRRGRSGKGYDNAHPRAQQAALTGWGARALASHQNMIEAFPLFAAGVLVVRYRLQSAGNPDFHAWRRYHSGILVH
ncbi:MAPEG family protein, partial [Halopseudomonas sp.]|uniref:MAPEG family protein n=1 Tax=Halopseudomonas sp. TaxID=2901191 RepID=UPI00300123E9